MMIFRAVYRPTRQVEALAEVSPYFPQRGSLPLRHRADIERYLYGPLLRAVLRVANGMKVLQAGSLHAYLAYVLVLGVLLLLWLGGRRDPHDADVVRAFGLAVLQAAGLLALAPLLKTAIKKMKARLQNRQGPPLLQGYYDLAKLFRKEPVRSETASWVFIAGPRVYFGAAVAATTLVPVLMAAAPLEAAGGILLLVGTLALGRFALATAALDTGSAFGGMGASRDMTIAALAEPALMLGLFTSALAAGSLNVGGLVRSGLQHGCRFTRVISRPSPDSSSS